MPYFSNKPFEWFITDRSKNKTNRPPLRRSEHHNLCFNCVYPEPSPPSATTDLNQQRRRRRREKPRRKSSHLIFPSSPRRHTINLSCPLQRQPKKSDNIESTPGVGPAKKNGQGRDTNNNSNGPVVVGLGCTEKFELCGIFVHLKKKKLKVFSDSPLASDATDHCFKSNI